MDLTTAAHTSHETADTIARFNDAFQRRDVPALGALVHDECVMVSAQPAPDGTPYVGKGACVAFWAGLMTDASTTFEVEHVIADGEWAAVRWRYRFGPTDAESVLGVNVTRVSGGRSSSSSGTPRSPARRCRCRTNRRAWGSGASRDHHRRVRARGGRPAGRVRGVGAADEEADERGRAALRRHGRRPALLILG